MLDNNNSINPILTVNDSNNEEILNKPVDSLSSIDDNIDNTTNCLALTVKENYHLVVVKNAFKKSCRVSWKVAVSIFVINFLNMFL